MYAKRSSVIGVQRRKKAAVEFNVMVAGHARSGKTSFINTLYAAIEVRNGGINPFQSFEDTNKMLFEPTSSAGIHCTTESGNVLLRLVDCPGLNIPPGLQKSSSSVKEAMKLQAEAYADSLTSYIESQFHDFLRQESKIRRDKKSTNDSRVHLMFYLINPDLILSFQGLSECDTAILKMLGTKVNIVICLAKSDLITVKDLKKIKEYLKESINNHGLRIFKFDNDYEENGFNNLSDNIAFTIINSEVFDENNSAPQRMGVRLTDFDSLVLGIRCY